MLLFSDLLNQKYLAAIYSYLFYLAFNLLIFTTFSRPRATSGVVTRKGMTTPLTHWVASGCYLCAGVVYTVLLGSPTSSITLVSYLRKITTAVVLHHPFLFGEIPRSFKRHRKEFLAPLPGRIFNIYQVPNNKSHLLAIYIICHFPLVFLSPTSQKIVVLFAYLFRLPFSRQIYPKRVDPTGSRTM